MIIVRPLSIFSVSCLFALRLMYSFKEILKNLCKTREGTTNIQQSRVIIPQRELPSFEAIDHPEFLIPMTSSSDANDSSGDRGSLFQSFDEQLIDTRIKSKKNESPSRGNGQQLSRSLTGQKAKEPVKAEVRSYTFGGQVYNNMQCNAP